MRTQHLRRHTSRRAPTIRRSQVEVRRNPRSISDGLRIFRATHDLPSSAGHRRALQDIGAACPAPYFDSLTGQLGG
jgi:hypothetical protein